MMVGALTAKAFVNNDIALINKGILGGPVAIAAIQIAPDQLSLNEALGTQDPAGVVSQSSAATQAADLSTGTLDGTQPFQANSAPKEEKDPDLLEKNQKAIKAAAQLASKSDQDLDPAPAPKKTGRYFIQPTSGKNWGVIHGHNAVDIANSCGTPVVAAAAGTVISDPGLGSGNGGNNGGYGNFVYIKHPNGTKTRYAHLSKISVAVGEKVEQGEQIGNIGRTGHVEGRTGCHLHFEVIGAANPLARR